MRSTTVQDQLGKLGGEVINFGKADREVINYGTKSTGGDRRRGDQFYDNVNWEG